VSRPHRLHFALALAGLLAAAAALAAGAGAVRVDPSAAGRLHAFGLHLSYPLLNLAAAGLLALAAVGATVLVRAAVGAWREVRALRRLRHELPAVGELAGRAVLVDREAPLAFCAGWLRPRVYLSTGAVARRGPDELRAVLAHEAEHAAARDPLRLAAARVLARALFFLPLLERLLAPQASAAELAADAAAVRAAGGDPAPLACALLAFDEAAPAGVGVAAERVDHLLGHPARWSPPPAALAASLAALSALVAGTWLTARAAHATASLAPPLVSGQPCVLVLGLVPLAGVGATLALASAARRRSAASRGRRLGAAGPSRAARRSRAPAPGPSARP
jgi:Zn-dependent protease with chaperone function